MSKRWIVLTLFIVSLLWHLVDGIVAPLFFLCILLSLVILCIVSVIYLGVTVATKAGLIQGKQKRFMRRARPGQSQRILDDWVAAEERLYQKAQARNAGDRPQQCPLNSPILKEQRSYPRAIRKGNTLVDRETGEILGGK